MTALLFVVACVALCAVVALLWREHARRDLLDQLEARAAAILERRRQSGD
jgi:hypothetical protein